MRMWSTESYHWQQVSQRRLPEGGKFEKLSTWNLTAARNFVLPQLFVMDSSNTENQEIRVLDPETPRAAPRDTEIIRASENDGDLVRKLLAEVSKIHDENKQLRKEIEDLKKKRETKLSQKSRDYDSECSVSSCSLFF